MNGLCARLLMNLILLEEGYPLVSFPGDDASRLEFRYIGKDSSGNK